ncbi:MAG: GNAT family N-acetyltransferase [Acidimicrobiia bacterium]
MPTDAAHRSFLEDVAAAQGYQPLSEAKVFGLERGESFVSIAGDDGICGLGVAVAHSAPNGTRWAVETAVHPSMQFPAFEERLLTATVDLVPEGERHTVWSARASLDGVLERSGYLPVRSLVEMGVDLPLGTSAVLPVRRFAADDLDDLIDLNNTAFADHPEAGNLDRQAMAQLSAQPWFDPDGILLHPPDGPIVAFCWTKVHPDGRGEIYRIGVRPKEAGMGIGSSITEQGLNHLAAEHGCTEGFLWVDETNAAAVAMYQRIGFTPRRRNREFAARRVQPNR